MEEVTPVSPKKSGSIIPIIIVVSLLIAGGVYFAVVGLQQTPAPLPLIPDNTTVQKVSE